MNTYTASCHCGDVKVQFESEPITEALSCNCSHCGRKGFLLTFIPKAQVKSLTGEDKQTKYLFNKKTITHLFCQTCGVEVYAESKMNDQEMLAVNLRTVEEIDPQDLVVNQYNGKDV